MAYSDFTLEGVLVDFRLSLDEKANLFADVVPREVAPALRTTLDEGGPLALAINTEKARSELIVVPILLEVRRLMDRRIGFFSGVRFDVEPERGLNGVCDYLLTRSPAQLVLGPPVLAVVEAKNDNLNSGLGQCVAELVAARIFNERHEGGRGAVFGVVTTGSIWRFLRLEADAVAVDFREHFLSQPEQILANLVHCVSGTA